nr:60S ribosomal protein L34 [Tanacetum cinerariifolium]
MKGICITIHHEGIFSYDPLSYDCGDVKVVENVDLGNTSYKRLMKIVKECCLFPVHGMHFCAPKVVIGKILKPLRNDSELANFVKLSYDNGCKVKLYVENHGYNIFDGVTEEVVDKELDDEIEIEDVSEFIGLNNVGEEDVELPNTGLNDTFLNMLVDGKFISDKYFRAKVDTQSSSSRNVDDSSVDGKFKVKEGFSYPFLILICHLMRWYHYQA